MQIAYTRAMISAVLSGALDTVAYEHDERFNLDLPVSCPGVAADVLNHDPRRRDAPGGQTPGRGRRLDGTLTMLDGGKVIGEKWVVAGEAG